MTPRPTFMQSIVPGPDVQVTLERNGAEWTGKIIGISDGPAVLVEELDGHRIMLLREGLVAKVPAADADD